MIRSLHWSLYFLLWLTGLLVAGTLLGLVTFPLFGPIFSDRFTTKELAVRGMRFMSFYFLIWAPGISIAATVMNSYKKKAPPERSL